jgi:serine phosphatase RsbU (regulator of sigma subunit)
MTLDATGYPLGLLEDNPIEPGHPVSLEPGDLVVSFTDGVSDTHNPHDEPFGIDRALEIVLKHRARPARAILQTLLDELRIWADGRPFADDVTALLVKAAP